ncbi:MAG: 2-oxo acid dehydrogenase subunit E2 [Polyangiaceae bacterium]|nr:2-oxo acid dehydrogenase subunit E2 [Polyangiaceae bacterium]
MAKVLDMPKLSPTMEEGQISAWHKEEGEEIGVDDLLAEVETDKATMEYRSFDKGTLLKILVPAGSVVRLGQPVAILGAPGEDISALVAELGTHGHDESPAADTTVNEPLPPPPPTPRNGAPATTQASPPAKVVIPAAPPTPRSAESMNTITATPSRRNTQTPSPVGPPVVRPTVPAPAGRVKASPYVRKLARERGLNLATVAGTGPGGRIVARDLEKVPFAETQTKTQEAKRETIPPPVPSVLSAPEARPLTMMRKAIARRLVESKQTVPHFYLTIDVDADPLNALRERINEDLAAAPQDEDAAPLKVSFNDLLVKACAVALVRVPECNAQFTPDAILVHRRVDISVAVAVADGLVTPVVRDANSKTVLEIASEVRELAGRARAKKLRPEEMANGTFSISNLGMYGIDEFAAVINPPEGAILAVGQVRREPVVKGDAVVPGRKMAMTLSCDHRVVDGAVGATFLKVLRQLLEHPTQILLL